MRSEKSRDLALPKPDHSSPDKPKPLVLQQTVKAVLATLSTACSIPELMVICKTRGGLLMSPRPSIYSVFEVDNWGLLCLSQFFSSKSEIDPRQDCKTTFPAFLRGAKAS